MNESKSSFPELYTFSKKENLTKFLDYVIKEANVNEFPSTEVSAFKQILSACILYLVFNIRLEDQTINNVISILSLEEETLDILIDDSRLHSKIKSYYDKYKKSGDINFRNNVRALCIIKLCSLYNLGKPIYIEYSDNFKPSPKIYQYFISYAYTDGNGIFGIANNTEVYTIKEFTDVSHIEELSNAVKEKFGYSEVTLISWKLLKTIESPNNDFSDKDINILNDNYKHIDSFYKN